MTRLAALASVVALLVGVSLPATAADDDPETAYLANCAGCHGAAGQGTDWAPSIVEEGAAGVDFMMRTGRMPLRRPTDPIHRREPTLDDHQRKLIVRFAERFDGPPVPNVDPSRGDPADGAALYLLDCAACHGATGVGGALVGSRDAPPILAATPLDIAEAIRSGPGPMPSFDRTVLDDRQVDSVVRYVLDLEANASHGGWSLGRWGPVAEGGAAWLIGIVTAIGAAYWIEGRNRPGREEANE